MKRTFLLWLGLVAFALMPAVAQNSGQPTGKIHGQVFNPTGQPQSNGTIGLSTDGGATFKYEFNVAADGTFSGEAAPGTYSLVYRQPETPKGQMVDEIKDVKIVAGQDTLQNDDMSREDYVSKMSADQRKQLEEIKKENSAAMNANKIITALNSDLRAVLQDKHDIESAAQAAQQQLGNSASKADIASKTEEIKTAKYTDIESMMTKDTAAKPDEALLWTNLGFAEAGLKKYDDAITDYKKALDLENAAKKPRPDVIGVADSGLGEVYARTGKVPEANAAYDAAAKADPTRGAIYLKNQAIIYFQQGNSEAQSAAADEAIKANPNDAVLYYIKGQALVGQATMAPDPKNPKQQIIVLPPGCAEAYQKYLDLAPNGQFAQDAAGILQQAGQKVSTSYKAPKGH